MLQIRAIQGRGIQEDGHRRVELTACFVALTAALRGSYSNTYSVYTECRQYLGCKQNLRHAVNDRLGIEPDGP